jgi:hypothetical protein
VDHPSPRSFVPPQSNQQARKACALSCVSLVCSRTVESLGHQIVVPLLFRSKPVRKVRGASSRRRGRSGPSSTQEPCLFHMPSTWACYLQHLPKVACTTYLLQCGREQACECDASRTSAFPPLLQTNYYDQQTHVFLPPQATHTHLYTSLQPALRTYQPLENPQPWRKGPLRSTRCF